MLLVVDTNVLIAALLRHSVTHHLLFSIGFELYAPEHSKEEMLKHVEEFSRKMEQPVSHVRQAIEIIFSTVSLVPKEDYIEWEEDAKRICASHPDDWPFVALALKISAPVWTNDKAFAKHSEIQVFSTEDILRILLR